LGILFDGVFVIWVGVWEEEERGRERGRRDDNILTITIAGCAGLD